MNFPPELQEEVEQWAKSVGLSVEQLIIQGEFDINAFVGKMREKRIQDQMKQVDL